MKSAFVLLFAACILIQSPRVTEARGFGGSRSGGGGSRGGYSSGGERGGNSSGAERGGNSSGAERGGSGERGGSSSGNRGSQGERTGNPGSEGQGGERLTDPSRTDASRSGNPNAAEGAYHHSGNSAYGGNSAYHQYPKSLDGYQTAGHAPVPTDAGYGAAAAQGDGHGYAASHATQPTNAAAAATSGAAIRNANPGAGSFNNNWYGAHPDAWHASGWAAGAEWHPTTWAAAAPTVGIAATAQPVSYDYGNTVTYQGNQVYMGGQPAATADQYYQQASNIAQSAPPADQKSPGWTPLGVYGLLRNQESSPHYLMQLAMHKSGAIAGNYTDLVNDTIQPIQGSVDRQTQRVAWTVGNNKNTVGEAGLYNLTQDEAPALIHIGQDRTQQWRLIRLRQAEAAADAQ